MKQKAKPNKKKSSPLGRYPPVELHTALEIIRANIKDILEALEIGSGWGYLVHNFPVYSDFQLYVKALGDAGKIRLLMMSEKSTRFIPSPPAFPSENDALDLMIGGRWPHPAEPDPLLHYLLQEYIQEKEMGTQNHSSIELFSVAYENRIDGSDQPSQNADGPIGDISSAHKQVRLICQKIFSRRIDVYHQVVDAVIAELRWAGLWNDNDLGGTKRTNRSIRDAEPGENHPQITKPDQNAPLSRWFDYMYECRRNRVIFTLKDIARESGRDYGHVRNEHSRYKLEVDMDYTDT